MGILGVIPARGNSKGIKNKNILNLNNKPLIGYTIEAALDANLLDLVVVSTDCRQISDVVKSKYSDVEVIERPSAIAKDDSPIEESLLHAIEFLENSKGFKTEIVVLMQANVPFRKKGVVDETIKNLIASDADSSVTCYEVDQIPEVMKIMDENGRLIPLYKDVEGIRRQEFSKKYLLDGSVVALRAKNLFETRGIRKPHIFLGKKIVPFFQEKRMYSLEIDLPDDVLLAKFYINQIDNSVIS